MGGKKAPPEAKSHDVTGTHPGSLPLPPHKRYLELLRVMAAAKIKHQRIDGCADGGKEIQSDGSASHGR